MSDAINYNSWNQHLLIPIRSVSLAVEFPQDIWWTMKNIFKSDGLMMILSQILYDLVHPGPILLHASQNDCMHSNKDYQEREIKEIPILPA